jgi:hypothetical protein
MTRSFRHFHSILSFLNNSGLSLSELNGSVDVVLGLVDKFVVDNGPELLAELRVVCHALDDGGELGSSLGSHILLVCDLREKDHNLLEALVLVAEDESGVLIQDVGEELILHLGLIDVVLDGKETHPVDDHSGEVDESGLRLNDLAEGGDGVVASMVELLDLVLLFGDVGGHLELDGVLEALQALVDDLLECGS